MLESKRRLEVEVVIGVVVECSVCWKLNFYSVQRNISIPCSSTNAAVDVHKYLELSVFVCISIKQLCLAYCCWGALLPDYRHHLTSKGIKVAWMLEITSGQTRGYLMEKQRKSGSNKFGFHVRIVDFLDRKLFLVCPIDLNNIFRGFHFVLKILIS